MGRGPELAIPIGQSIKDKDSGIVVVVEEQPGKPDPYANVTPSKTAIYEARHAVLAKKRGIGVISATARQGPGYLGATFLEGFDPVVAMAHPGDGDGHDRAITIYMGHNPDAAASTAKALINENKKAINRVARAMDANGSLGGAEISREIAAAEEKVEPLARLRIRTDTGKLIEIADVKVENKTAKVPGGVFDFAKAKQEKAAKRAEEERLKNVRAELAELEAAA